MRNVAQALKNMRFKTKVLLIAFSLIFFPLCICSTYVYLSQQKVLILEDSQSIRVEEKLLSELISDSFRWNISELMLHIAVTKKSLEGQSKIIKDGLIQAFNLYDDALTLIVTNNLLSSINSGKLHVFIYNRESPELSIFYRDSDRELLEGKNDFSLGNLEYILSKYIIDDEYSFFFIYHKDIPYLICVTNFNKYLRICCCLDLVSMYRLYSNDVSKESIKQDLNATLSSVNFIDYQNSYIKLYDAKGNALNILNDNDELLNLPQEILDKCRESNNNWIGYFNYNDTKYYTSISYLPSLEWFAAVIKNVQRPVDNLRKNLAKVFVVGFIMVLLSIFCCSYLLKRPLTNIQRIVSSAEKIEQTEDLADAKDLEKLNLDLPVKNNDDIGRLARTFEKMVGYLSNNVNLLLTANAQEDRLEGELNAAKAIQIGILPADLTVPDLQPLDISGCMFPAKQVGGDLYDVLPLDDHRVAIIIGDVSDKGVPAALFMSMSVTIIRECINLNLSPKNIMNEVNKILCAHNPNMMFVTLFVGILDKNTMSLCYSNGGHCQPLYYKNGVVHIVTGLSGPAPGVVENFEYSEFVENIDGASCFFMYTDGVSEAQNEEKTLFGEERIKTYIAKHGMQGAHEILNGLMDEIAKFRQDALQSDDITMLALSFAHSESGARA